jgi:peptide/nickel transport system permease protein
VQVWDFVTGALHGNLGTDFIEGVPVTTLIGNALPDTFILATSSILLSVAGGLILGILAARRPSGVMDRALACISIVCISVPGYVFGLGLLLIFAVRWQWLPSLGAGNLSQPLDYARHLVLPSTALALPWCGYLGRFVRANMLEVAGASHVRTARALGLRERVVFRRYVVRNALVPVAALLGLMVGGALAGTVYVEVIFNRSGLGTLAYNAILSRDWPIIRAVVVLYAVFFVLANLTADLSYRWLDPRLRSDFSI